MKKIILSLLLVLSLAACDNKQEQSSQNQKPTIKIGVIYPMSGNAAFFGEGAKNASELFFKDFNKQKAKYDYQIIWEDSQANPAKAVMVARKLIDYDKVDVIIDSFSNVGNAVSPITNEKKIPLLTFAQDKSISTGIYSYRVVTSTEKTGVKLRDALDVRNLHNVVGVVENTSGTMSLFNGFKSVAENSHVKIKDVYNINPGEKDFSVILQKIKESKAEAVVVSLQSPAVDIFLKQAKNNSVNIPIVGIQSFSFLKDKNLAEGSWYVDVAFTDNNFLKKYSEYTGNEITNFAENFYTMLAVVTKNFETAETVSGEVPSSEQFIRNMSSVQGLKTPIGILELDRQNQNLDSEASIRMIKRGKIIEVKE